MLTRVKAYQKKQKKDKAPVKKKIKKSKGQMRRIRGLERGYSSTTVT